MDTAEDFEAQLDANDQDWELRMVYADWLDEQGDSELARAQRWMVKHGCYPYGPNRVKCWANFSVNSNEDRSKLPDPVWAVVREFKGMGSIQISPYGDREYRYYGPRRVCERVLAKALAQMGVVG
jgi:uncharacterized protein (TIGR02996 family)